MTLYSIALFAHIAGAVLIFVLLTVEGVGLRSGMAAARLNRVLGPISALLILVPGFYMAAQTGWYAWTEVGLATYVLIAAVGAYTGISVMRGRMAASAAAVSWLLRIGMAAGVLFDMTVKPDLAASIAAVVVGVALGALAARPALRLVKVA